ncbi:MAG: hypothetical protein HOP35_10885 [Nitrospira sp.]|nr:hypothetical protein [Nitrospira sp.]
MNVAQFRKMVGDTVVFRPSPLDEKGLVKNPHNSWIIVNEVEKRVFLFKNKITNHEIRLGIDCINKFISPNFVMLHGDITLKDGGEATFEPSVASIGWPSTGSLSGRSRKGAIIVGLSVLAGLNLATIVYFNFVIPTIKIQAYQTTDYEAGKPFPFKIILKNSNTSEMKLRGPSVMSLVTQTQDNWPFIEEGLWATAMSKPESTYDEFTIYASDKYPKIIFNGPSLTQEQINQLRVVDHKTAVYLVGELSYTEWYGVSRKLKFCGSYRHDPRSVYACENHSDWRPIVR